MADETAQGELAEPQEAPESPGEAEAPRQPPSEPAAAPIVSVASWLRSHRTLALSGACLGLCALIAFDVFIMLRKGAEQGAPVAAASVPAVSAVTPAPVAPLGSATQVFDSVAPAVSGKPGGSFEDFSDDGEPHQSKPAPPKHFSTVQQAAVESCTTASVDGLSRQIIEQARCTRPNAFVPLPARPNLVIASQVFPYLEAEARKQLLKALDSRKNEKMTINSALRTVAQQYLVWRWSATKRCGVPLATPPGESNHEIGSALDIAEAGTWRPVLEQHDFKWLGAADRVHFDYKPKSAPPRSVADVLAFQTLWNRNHPTDKITASGRYDAATEQRLKQAPPDGFALGASCGKPGKTR